MSTLRGFVWRPHHPSMDAFDATSYGKPWDAAIGHGTWIDPDNMTSDYLGPYSTQPEALAAVCQRLMDEAVVEDIVRRAEGKEAGA